jgi:hypothetical protein
LTREKTTSGTFDYDDDEEDLAMVMKLAADPATPHAAVRILVDAGLIAESEAESFEIPPPFAAVVVLRAMDAAIENDIRGQKRAARDRRKRALRDRRKREKQKRRGKR